MVSTRKSLNGIGPFACGVDCFFGHDSVGGPLAAGDGHLVVNVIKLFSFITVACIIKIF
jgi:hypothetical protein